MAVLTEDFLKELYGTALISNKIGANIVTHINEDYLPNRHFQKIHNAIQNYWSEYKEMPSFGNIAQTLSGDSRCTKMLESFKDSVSHNIDATLSKLEQFIVEVRTKQATELCVKHFNNGEVERSLDVFRNHSEWVAKFSLKPSKMIDVFSTYKDRFESNKRKSKISSSTKKNVCRFYIDELDRVNDGRSLRGQLSVFMASSGVGKTHLARHIGLEASLYDGLDVLHVQLEGTEDEVMDAYSASIAKANAQEFEQGTLPDESIEEAIELISKTSGTLMVKSFSKFGAMVSTLDVKKLSDEFLESVGKYPDIIIVDSMDILTDFRKTKKVREEMRHLRLAVAEDLKNLAIDLDCHVVSTYQATIENAEFLDNEEKVLTRYHISEGKGIIRPMTNFVTLNQSSAEKEENSMRLNVDKARFFDGSKCGVRGVIRIKCDYDKGMFYDSEATLRLVV